MSTPTYTSKPSPLSRDEIQSLLDSVSDCDALSPEGQELLSLISEAEGMLPMGTPTPAEFRRMVIIETETGKRPLSEAVEPWQLKDFEALDPAWMRIAGLSSAPCKMQAWMERPKGHSKTTDIAVMVLWALYASLRPLSGVAAARDKDQARLLRDSAKLILRDNPWLAARVKINQYEMSNPATGAKLVIEASDAPGSHGKTPDFVVLDELAHWERRDLWDALYAGSGKRANCLVVVITNAGMGKGTSWQWKLREDCRVDPEWFFSRLDGPQASWITEASLARQRKRLLPREYQRLWLNIWTAGAGDALDISDVDACMERYRVPSRDRADSVVVLIGMDLGIKRDHSATFVLGIRPNGKFRMLQCRSWAPDPETGTVDLVAVQDSVQSDYRTYGAERVYFDQTEAQLMAQQLARLGVAMEPVPFSAKNLDLMATRLVANLRDRVLELYPDVELHRDLGKVQISERITGFKLDGLRDEHGHCDKATALAIVNAMAVDWWDAMVLDEQEMRDAS